MQLYRFSPIKSKEELFTAIEYIHFACHNLCKNSLSEYLPVIGNITIFCHYENEYSFLTKLREELTGKNSSFNNKYFKLYKPITIQAKDGIPEASYTHLYIRQPDPYRAQVGDVDFFVTEEAYEKLIIEIQQGKKTSGLRIFDAHEPQMLELFDPDIDVLSYAWSGVMPT